MKSATIGGGIRIAYDVIGNGIPVLVLHGFSLDQRVMKGCLEPVFRRKRGVERIYLDLPGMGESKARGKIRSSDEMLKILLAFLRRRLRKKRFGIIGYSYGAYLARGILHHMKGQVSGIAMICPVVVADQDKRTLPRKKVAYRDDRLVRSAKAQVDEKGWEVFDSLVIQRDSVWKRCKKEIIPALRKADPAVIKAMEKAYSFSFEDRLDDSFDGPALFLMGKWDSIVGYKDALALLNRYPNSNFTVIDDAGHNLQIEHPRLFNRLIGGWVRGIRW